MKKSILGMLAAIACMAGSMQAQVVNFDSLNYWGTGANKSALVVQWNDSKSPGALAWGYRWDGPAPTVADMVLFLAANDDRFFARIDSSTQYGTASIFGFGYQTGTTPFGVTGAQDAFGDTVDPLVFTSGINDMNTDSLTTQAPFSSSFASPTNPSDRYIEAWLDNGFWEMFNAGSDNFVSDSSHDYPTLWTSSWVGSSTSLVNEGWYAFSISDTSFNSNLPGAATAAIPEPSSLGLALLGAGAIFWLRRKSRVS